MKEDSTSKFSTDNAIYQDEFPTYNNNIVDEDLEYNHIKGDATQDEYEITEYDIDSIVERIISSMNGSSTVDVKKKCKLGGLGNTSLACNQGDINNFNVKPLKEYNLIEIIKEESLFLSNKFYNWFKNSKVVDAQGKPLIVYHGTNKDFNRFNLSNAAQPIIWFSADKDKILRGESGAAGRSRIIPAYISIQKMAGWNEYEKYGLGQLQDMGFDGAKLDDDYFVFNPRQIKIIKEKTNEEVHDFHLYKEEIMNEAQLMSLQDLEKMENLQKFVNIINQKPFIKSLINDYKTEVYLVGGAVRDLILNKPNKDIDLVVGKIEINSLINILQKFGKVDIVGKSFGVLKFVDKDGTDYDIALPRKEKPTGTGGYHGFDVQSDPNLPIEDELSRRDAKFNAMAINLKTSKFIDPLGGLKDIENKQISAANSEAFSDDPLRMLRMVGFASRFGFTIEPLTMKMIQDNASRIKEIPPERIITEFDKIIHKGNKRLGAQLLKNTGLFNNIFGFDINQSIIDRSPFEEIVSMGEFIFLLTRMLSNPSEFFKNNLKGDLDSYKEIKSLELAYQNYEETIPVKARVIAHNMYLISPLALKSNILPTGIKNAANELLQGKYPKTVNELAVNGNDLMQIGLKGKEIGDTQKNLLTKIYADKIANNKENLLALISKNNINEEKKSNKQIEYGCLMLFLDIPVWEKITSIIKPEDVYNENDEYGIEKEPHLTILYGFHDEVNAEDVFSLFKKHMPLEPIEVCIGGISIFENPEFDVVKFEVNSPILKKLNFVMSKLPNTSKFKDYIPHITIGYVKSGEGKKYIKSFDKERKLKGDELVYSWKGREGKDEKKMMLNSKKDLNENVIKYSEVKSSLMRSKSISKEMKEIILKYLSGGSTYHEGGKIHGLIKPKEFTEKTSKSSGVSLGADKNGFYCYTHRARCKSYNLPEKISIKDINYIESTG